MMKNQNSIKIQKNKAIYIGLFFVNIFTLISIDNALAKINLESAISSARENNLEILSISKNSKKESSYWFLTTYFSRY